MNMEALTAMTSSIDPKSLQARLRALATNVMQESKVAHGRGDKPFTDDDAQRLDAIYSLLHLAKVEEINTQYEHYPLVSITQSKPDPMLNTIADMLSGGIENAVNEVVERATPAPVSKRNSAKA